MTRYYNCEQTIIYLTIQQYWKLEDIKQSAKQHEIQLTGDPTKERG